MPIYEFHCNKCNKDFEELVFSTSTAGVECRHCGSKNIVKKLSLFAFKSSGNFSSASSGSCSGCSAASCSGCGAK